MCSFISLFLLFNYELGMFFYARIPFIYPDNIFLLSVSEFPILFAFLKTVWCRPNVHEVINLFLWFSQFVASSAFPKYLVAWHNCYYKWRLFISLGETSLDFYFCLNFPPAINSALQFFMTSAMNLMTLSDIFYIFRYFTNQDCGTLS